jgi:hypothetical protein
MYCGWRFNDQEGSVEIPLTGLTPSQDMHVHNNKHYGRKNNPILKYIYELTYA